MQYSLSVWRRVLTPLQTAHLNVTAYPHKVSLCCCERHLPGAQLRNTSLVRLMQQPGPTVRTPLPLGVAFSEPACKESGVTALQPYITKLAEAVGRLAGAPDQGELMAAGQGLYILLPLPSSML